MAKTFVDFVGLNTFVNQEITASNGANIIGYPLSSDVSSYENVDVVRMDSGSDVGTAALKARNQKTGQAQLFSALNLKRNGPYGYSSWKQIRVSENPLTRYHNKNSDFTFVSSKDGEIRREITTSNENIPRKDRYSSISQFEEPAVTSKTHPLVWNVGAHERNSFGEINLIRFSMKSAYGNNLLGLSNDIANRRLGINLSDEDLEYSSIKEMYLSGALNNEDNPLTHWEFLQYRESVFPQAKYAYRKENRNRENFKSFYRNNRKSRTALYLTSSFGNSFHMNPAETSGESIVKLSQSSWPLDVGENWSTRAAHANQYIPAFSSSGAVFESSSVNSQRGGPGYAGAGILMNNYSQFNIDFFDPPIDTGTGAEASSFHWTDYNMGIAPTYSRRHTLRFTGSFSNPSGLTNQRTSSTAADLAQEMFQGNALWEAGKMAGKNPIFDRFSDFNSDIRLKAKDYSVVPEFRISNHVEQIIAKGSSFTGSNMFEITGGQTNNYDSSFEDFYKVYSNSDFLKHFEVFKEDHEDFANSKILTLRCKAIKKFLPYEGFYPCQRTVQLAERFKESYLDYIQQEDIGVLFGTNPAFLEQNKSNQPKQILMTPLFSPGIMFNSIKSGVAVDFPMFVEGESKASSFFGTLDDMLFTKDIDSTSGDAYLIKSAFNKRLAQSPSSSVLFEGITFGERIPFEAMIDPERYISQKTFRSIEPHPSGNLSASVGWSGQGDDLYKLMANNFFSEVPDFFLQNSSFSSLVSREQKFIKPFEANKTYSMRIKMFRSMDSKRLAVSSSNGTIYYPPQDIISSSNTPRETFTMYSRPSAFGPPSLGISNYVLRQAGGGVDSLEQVWYGDRIHSTGSNRNNIHMDSRHGFNFPYTPPYYHGEAWMDIHVNFSTGGQKTLDEIFTNIENNVAYHKGKDYFRAYDVFAQGSYILSCSFGSGPQSFLKNNINKNAMQLTASLNVFGQGALKSIDLLDDDSRQEVNLVVNTQEENEKRWVIQTKFETPMLNFNHLKDTNRTNTHITLPQFGEASVPIGMWHQYGKLPSSDEGVFLQITDIPKSWVEKTTVAAGDGTGADNGFNGGAIATPYFSKATGSLVDQCGFSTAPIKLGQVAKKKVVREAVVAIPFVEFNGRKRFFKLDANEVEQFLTPSTKNTSKTGLSVKQQLEKMKRYILPPSFDFVNNKAVDPIAMYIFEFSQTLGQQDLADIWQNLPPTKISQEYEEATAVISHPLLEKELLGSGKGSSNKPIDYPNELRWMIFKVKQKANNNYFTKVFSSDSNLGETATKRLSRVTADQFGNTVNVQYNWPYDFFSLVELVKLDAEIEFNNIDYSNFEEELPQLRTISAKPNVINRVDSEIPPTEYDVARSDTDAPGSEAASYEEISRQQDDLAGYDERPEPGPQSQQGNQQNEELQLGLETSNAQIQAAIQGSKSTTGGLNSGQTGGGGGRAATLGGVDTTVGGSIIAGNRNFYIGGGGADDGDFADDTGDVGPLDQGGEL